MRTFFHLLVGLCVFVSAANAALTCSSSAVPTVINAEGLTERMGDILLTCSGGTAGQTVTGNLTLFQSVNITNRTGEDGRTDVALSVDNGSAPPPPPVFATASSASQVTFNGLSFNLSAAGGATLRITNLRGAAAPQPVTVSIAGPMAISYTTLNVGLPTRGLLSSSSSATVYCVGSPAASSLYVSAFFAAGTSFHSTRFTEGWANAFQKRTTGTDSGTRVMARYSGLPTGARLFVPDYIAGSNATQPTSGGDLGVVAQSGGKYTGGSGALLLALVRLTDANGAGGYVTGQAPPSGVTAALDSASEVPLLSGSGVVVYEVVESNSAQQESAQFPAFLIYTPPEGGGSTALARQEVSFAPVSTTAVGNASAPIPRFAFVAQPSDCSVWRDCDASYFPRLFVRSPPLNFTAPAGSAFQFQEIGVHNDGGGILNWTIAVNYRNGSGWIVVDPASGQNNTAIRV
ncbi:MAG: hypothetical protein NT090_03715, partial [Acidobacteria bacterium]|nr:hypothetical protein [Acidobacteriota bacterium]